MTTRRPDLPPPRAAGWLAVTVAVVGVTVARLGLLSAGPDLDFDAATHALIGRRFLSEWRDIHIHWVWLPLWHVLHAAVITLGGNLGTIRRMDVGVSALAPFLLVLLLQTRARTVPAVTPWVRHAESVIPFAAGVLFAIWPGGVETGESGEPEAFFQCAVLATCLLWERRRPVAAGCVLSLAALTRYEAWVLPPVFLLLWALGPRTRRAAAAWLIPGAVITAWCAFHAWRTHELFEFLRVNREYVRDAWQDLRLLQRRPPAVQHPWAWYPWVLPRRSLGDAVYWCLPGAAWLFRRGPRALAATGVTLLGFITLVWIRRMNLGLPRHFAVLVPVYATAAAAGLCTGVAWLAHRLAPTVQRRMPTVATPVLTVVLVSLVSLWADARIVTRRTVPNVRLLRVLQSQAYLSERRAAAVVRANLTGRARAFCDQTEVEIYTNLPPERFIRWNAKGIAPYNFFVEAAQRGHALVVSVPRRVTQLRSTSQTLYDDGHLVVLRREGPAVVDPRVLRAPVAH